MAFTPPAGWSRISSSLVYDDPRKAIDFLCKAFGFKVQILVGGQNDSVVHSELVIDGGIIMVGGGSEDGKGREWRKSPQKLGGANTQALMVFVADVEAHFKHSKENGATIVTEPKTSDYGEDYWVDRSYECADLEGHHWYFVQRIKTGKG